MGKREVRRMNVRHVVSISGGKDSTALLLLALERCSREHVFPIFCDTGNEDAAVYEYLNYLEFALGIKIMRLKADFSRELVSKRQFIARDARNRREYSRAPVFEADGMPVPKRDGRGQIVTRKVRRGGRLVEEPVQKTRKIGGGRRVRWTNKAKRRALSVMYPTGNPFLDLCMWKGRFPSRKAQFCTEELKTAMAVGFQLELMERGHRVISWQGVRRDESDTRRNAKLYERIGHGLWAFRPLVDWTATQVLDFARVRGIQPNPLYRQGMGRVGCMPCINCNKPELRAIALRFAGHLHRISEWERLVGMCSKRGFSTFMADAHPAADRRRVFADLNIWSRVEWAQTTRGGKQFDLLAQLDEPTACSSSYGLCDQAA